MIVFLFKWFLLDDIVYIDIHSRKCQKTQKFLQVPRLQILETRENLKTTIIIIFTFRCHSLSRLCFSTELLHIFVDLVLILTRCVVYLLQFSRLYNIFWKRVFQHDFEVCARLFRVSFKLVAHDATSSTALNKLFNTILIIFHFSHAYVKIIWRQMKYVWLVDINELF